MPDADRLAANRLAQARLAAPVPTSTTCRQLVLAQRQLRSTGRRATPCSKAGGQIRCDVIGVRRLPLALCLCLSPPLVSSQIFSVTAQPTRVLRPRSEQVHRDRSPPVGRRDAPLGKAKAAAGRRRLPPPRSPATWVSSPSSRATLSKPRRGRSSWLRPSAWCRAPTHRRG